ncbi:hypothetical protein FBU31_007934, partial [Coemansia sp. 'formosensis']
MAVDSKRGSLGLGEVEGSSGVTSTGPASSAHGSRVVSMSIPAVSTGADRWTSVAAGSRNGSRGYPSVSVSASPVSAAAAAAATDDVKVNGVSKAKVDEIIERAWRLGMRQSKGGDAAPTSSATQLVTPDTEDEPATKLARSSSMVDTKRLANGLSRRTSANSLAGVAASSAASTGAPAAKREKLEKKATSELAAFVVKAMTKYKGQLGHDDFKHEAKKITKVLMEKERKS